MMFDGLMDQSIAWWRRSGQDAYGQPAFASGQTISGRWETSHVEFLDTQNQRQVSQAVVDFYGSGITVAPGDMLTSGVLSGLPSGIQLDPRSGSGCVVIRQVDKTVSFDGSETWVTAYV